MASRAMQIALVAVTTVMLLLTLAVNYLSSSDLGRSLGLFSPDSTVAWTNRGNLTGSSLTPPGWAFSVWGAIYLYQGVMLAYCWSLVFRWHDGEALCCIPGLLSVGFLVTHSISSVFNIAWVFMADRAGDDKNILVPQTIVLFLLAILLWVCLVFSFQHLSANMQDLQQAELQREYWLVIALVQNACGLYVGWASIASFLNLDIAIVNLTDYPIDNSALLCLCQVCLLIGVYVTADFSFLDRYLRFFFTPYIVLLWALATSLIGNFKAGSAKSDVTVQLVVLLVGVLVAKVVVAIVRQKRNPLPGNMNSSRVSGDGGFKSSRLELS